MDKVVGIEPERGGGGLYLPTNRFNRTQWL